MDKIAKQFLDYLIYIGLVTNESITCFIGNLKNKVSSSDKLKEILKNTLFSYLNSLTNIDKKSISATIVNIFFENKIKANEHILEYLLTIYERNKLKTLQNYINKWYTITFSYDLNKIIKFSAREKIFDTLNNNSNFIEYSNGIDSKLNIKHKRIRSHRNKERSNDNLNSNGNNTFFSNFKKNKSNNTSKSIINDFINRQDDYNKSRSIRREKLKKLSDIEYENACTFSPKIVTRTIDDNYNHNHSNQNIYQKLYEDSTRRQVAHNKKVNEYVKHIKSESNKNFSSKNGSNHSKQIVSKDKIQKLYNDYKNKSVTRKKLTNKINNENGITFKPIFSKIPDYLKKSKIISTTSN